MKMSHRIRHIASLIDRSSVIVDIGSNHGQLPLYLLTSGHPLPIYATEYSLSSFQALKQFLNDTPIQAYQADGLAHLPTDCNTLVIAGMGGSLIVSILKDLFQFPGVTTLILGPQKDNLTLRKNLVNHGFYIEDEEIIKEKGHFYPLIKALRGQRQYSDIEFTLGPKLMEKKSAIFIEYLDHYRTTLLRRKTLSQADILLKAWIEDYVKD
jgi:tRNA (adenine22-N1)-methyltransferase